MKFANQWGNGSKGKGEMDDKPENIFANVPESELTPAGEVKILEAIWEHEMRMKKCQCVRWARCTCGYVERAISRQ